MTEGVTKAEFSSLHSDVKDVKKMLLGNGELGFVGRVIAVETDLKGVHADLESARTHLWQVFMKLVPWAGITGAAFYIGSASSGGMAP